MDGYLATIDWLRRYGIGEIAGAFGFIATVIGFAVTLINVFRTRKAAEAAAIAASDAREHMHRFQTTVTLAQVIAGLDELKPLHRERKWDIAATRYGQLKRELINIRQRLPVSAGRLERVQSSIVLLSALEREVDGALQAGVEPTDMATMNQRISEQVEHLHVLLLDLERPVAGEESVERED